MKSIIIHGKKRESLGKISNNILRCTEQVPCVLYNKDGEIFHFSTSRESFRKLIYTPNSYMVIIELEEGEKIEAIVKGVQFHPVTECILHADFCQLNNTKRIIMPVPIKTIGRSIGISQGGTIRLMIRKLIVKTFPKKFPDSFEIDISLLSIGDKIYVKDILNDNYIFMHSNATVIIIINS